MKLQQFKNKIKIFILFVIICNVQSIFAFTGWEKVMYDDLAAILESHEADSNKNKTKGKYFYTGSNDRHKVFTDDTKKKINEQLLLVDSVGRKTIMYVAYQWFEYKGIDGKPFTKTDMNNFITSRKKAIDGVKNKLLADGYETDNLNLFVSMLAFVKTNSGTNLARVTGWHRELYIDCFYPRPDMNASCWKNMRNTIGNSIKSKGVFAVSKSPNDAMIERAKLLKTTMLDCPTIPEQKESDQQNVETLLNYVKEKVEKEEKVMLNINPKTDYVAENIKLAKTTYTKIQWRQLVKKTPSFSDPLSYKVEVNETTTPKTASFLFYSRDSTDKLLFAITLFDEKAKEKKDSLEKWLFGENQSLNLAIQILKTGKVKLANLHCCAPKDYSNDDNANANNNIDDSSKDLPAQTSPYVYENQKKYPNINQFIDLDITMLRGMLDLTKKFTFTVSEITGGGHSANSRHYAGIAFDITYINGVYVTKDNSHLIDFKDEAKKLGATEILGPGDDKNHKTHVHLAWPRK